MSPVISGCTFGQINVTAQLRSFVSVLQKFSLICLYSYFRRYSLLKIGSSLGTIVDVMLWECISESNWNKPRTISVSQATVHASDLEHHVQLT